MPLCLPVGRRRHFALGIWEGIKAQRLSVKLSIFSPSPEGGPSGNQLGQSEEVLIKGYGLGVVELMVGAGLP